MFKFKQCKTCGIKNKKHHEHCTKCGSVLDNVLKTSTMSLVIFLVCFLLLSSTATYASYGVYKLKTHKPTSQNTVQVNPSSIPVDQSPKTVISPDSKQTTTANKEAIKTTPGPKKTTINITPTSSPVQSTTTPAPTATPVNTPVPAPTIAKLDNQTKINFLTSYNQWLNESREQWVSGNPMINDYCTNRYWERANFSRNINYIHDSYDLFEVSKDFSDIPEHRDDIWKKGLDLAVTRDSLCNKSEPIQFQQDITKFQLLVADFNNLISGYKQKIDYHS